MSMPPEEFERVVTAYMGGKLREGAVPVGAASVPAEARGDLVARIAASGFALSFEDHKDESALVVATLKTFEALQTMRSLPKFAAPLVESHDESPKEG